MWFLEVYFKDGSEKMYSRRALIHVQFLRDAFIEKCGDEIEKFVSYSSDGQNITGEATTLP